MARDFQRRNVYDLSTFTLKTIDDVENIPSGLVFFWIQLQK